MAKLKDVQDAQAEEAISIAISKISADIQALKDKIANGGAVTMADLDGLVAAAKAGTAELTADDQSANS